MKYGLFAGIGTLTVVFLMVLFAAQPVSLPAFGNNDNLSFTYSMASQAPTLTRVDCNNSATFAFTPTPLQSSTLDCVLGVTDTNGYAEITSANLSLYLSGSAEIGAGGVSNATDNYNEHYYNGTCIKEQGASNDQKFSCNLTIRYWANASTWTLDAWAWDDSGLRARNNSATVTINELLSLTVTNTSVDFGSSLSPGTYVAQKAMEVVNQGNNDTDLLLYESGGATNGQIECTTGTASAGTYIKYNMSGDFGNSGDQEVDFTEQAGNSLQASSTAYYFNFTHLIDNSGTEETAKQNLYWILYVPSGVSGTCNGQITALTTSRN